MASNSKVYVLNKGPHDYSGAEKYGELVFCTTGSLDKDDISQMYRVFTDVFHESEPYDMILLTSLASLCSVACSVFVAMHGELHLLIHKGAREDGYLERSLYFDDNTQGDNVGNTGPISR